MNVCGDFHYGTRGVEKDEITNALNRATEKAKGNLFRIFTGDNVENALSTSVGHNYDIAIPDPADQKNDMIDIFKEVTAKQYGSKYKNFRLPTNTGQQLRVKAVGVEGNHEYRTRKLTGQWLASEMYREAKIMPLGMHGIVELTLTNQRLKMSKTYRIFVAHRPGKTSATSFESILRAFRKKQQGLPGIDAIVFGHYHKRFVQADGYFDPQSQVFKKVLYVINPSPMQGAEYAEEAGYPPLEIGHYVNFFLPLEKNKQPYALI